MTSAGRSVVRHLKSPGSQIRCSQGRHGSPVTSSASAGIAGLRHGADRAGSVGPYRPTIGVVVVAAICKGPVSPPMNSRLRDMRERSSDRLNSPNSMIRLPCSPSDCLAAAAMRRAASWSDGPELMMIRRRSDSEASVARTSVNAGSGQRRNGIAGADVRQNQFVLARDTRSGEAAIDCRVRVRIRRHLDGIALCGRAHLQASRRSLRAGPTDSPPNGGLATPWRAGPGASTSTRVPLFRSRCAAARH